MTTDDIAQRLAELERQVTAQQETIERQQARIEQQAETIKRHQSRIEQQAELLEHQDSPVPSQDPGAQAAANGPERNGDRASTLVSRRSLLSAAAAVGVGSFATGAASATEPRGVVGTDQHPVRTLYLQTLGGPLTDGTAVTTLSGDGLTLDGGALETDLTTAGAGTPVGTRSDDGATQLRGLAEGDNVTITEDAGTITVGASDTRADVSEDGTTVASSVEDINFDGRSVSVTRSGDGVAVEVDDENTDTQTDVSDSGSMVVFSTSDIDFGANLSASSDGVGGATVDADVQGATNWARSSATRRLQNSSPRIWGSA